VDPGRLKLTSLPGRLLVTTVGDGTICSRFSKRFAGPREKHQYKQLTSYSFCREKTSRRLTRNSLLPRTSHGMTLSEDMVDLFSTGTQTTTTPDPAGGGQPPNQLASRPSAIHCPGSTLDSSGFPLSWMQRLRPGAVLVSPTMLESQHGRTIMSWPSIKWPRFSSRALVPSACNILEALEETRRVFSLRKRSLSLPEHCILLKFYKFLGSDRKRYSSRWVSQLSQTYQESEQICKTMPR
jgi:hypothetical protein